MSGDKISQKKKWTLTLRAFPNRTVGFSSINCLSTLGPTSAHSALSGMLNIFLLRVKEIWAFEVDLHIIIVSKAKGLEDKEVQA